MICKLIGITCFNTDCYFFKKKEVSVLTQEFLFTLIITFFVVLIINYIGQRLIVNNNKLSSKNIWVVVIQSLVIAILLTFIF